VTARRLVAALLLLAVLAIGLWVERTPPHPLVAAEAAAR